MLPALFDRYINTHKYVRTNTHTQAHIRTHAHIFLNRIACEFVTCKLPLADGYL